MISQRIIQENPGREVVYFRNAFEDAVLKQVNSEGVYVKFKGGKEFYARAESGIVADAVMELNIDYIDDKTYNDW